ncbi:MAG: hypothetical protein ACO3MW_02075 [Rhodospirillales bacterium]
MIFQEILQYPHCGLRADWDSWPRHGLALRVYGVGRFAGLNWIAGLCQAAGVVSFVEPYMITHIHRSR